MSYSKKQNMFKIQKDNIIFSSPVSPVLQADFLKLSSWGSPLKEKEEKNMLSQKKNPSRGFANEGQTCARLSSR